MDQLLPGFESIKTQIPEFVLKLYHILEKKQFQDYLCWHGDSEILIKSGKKLQDKVLPHYFRHKHISSFIRQLNMYKFSKVTKLTKQRNYMYFKNQHFKRGNIQQLVLIKRNNKKNQKNGEDFINNNQEKSQNVDRQIYEDGSIIDTSQMQNYALDGYKREVGKSMKELNEILKRVMINNPEAVQELSKAQLICMQMMEQQKGENNFQSPFHQFENYPQNQYFCQEQNKNKEMLTTVKNLPKMEDIFFISQYSFNNLN